jgi:hypothetical protein
VSWRLGWTRRSSVLSRMEVGGRAGNRTDFSRVATAVNPPRRRVVP